METSTHDTGLLQTIVIAPLLCQTGKKADM